MLLRPKPVDFDATWGRIRDTMHAVLSCKPVPRAVWNDTFTDVYYLCIQLPESMAPRLHYEIKVFFEQHVTGLRKKVQSDHLSNDGCSSVMGDDDDSRIMFNLLSSYHSEWLQYSKGIGYLHAITSYLNLQYIRNNQRSDADMMYGYLSVPVNSRDGALNYRSNDKDYMKMEIGALGLDIWVRHMMLPLKDDLTALLMAEFERRRKCQFIDDVPLTSPFASHSVGVSDEVLRGVIQSFVAVEGYRMKVTLELYHAILEEPLVQSTGDYYAAESKQLLLNDSSSIYMTKVIQRLDVEDERCRRFLHATSHKKIRGVCEDRMVAGHLDILYAECKNIVERESVQDLANMYQLLKPITSAQMAAHATSVGRQSRDTSESGASSNVAPMSGTVPPSTPSTSASSATSSSNSAAALHLLITSMGEHIEKQGIGRISALTNEQTLAVDFVTTVLAVHDHFRELIASVFDNDPLFGNAMGRSMTAIVNYRIKVNSDQAAESRKSNLFAVHGQHSRAPELLARYCDGLLRKAATNAAKVSELDIDAKLQRSICIFRYLDDKDVFQRFYGRNLGKRLIHQQSQSMALEETMIKLLTEACGYDFTTKFHRMYNDIALADDLNGKFTDYIRRHSIDVGINYFVRILQPSAWPLSHQALGSGSSVSTVDSVGTNSGRDASSTDSSKSAEQSLLYMIVPQPLVATIGAYEKFYAAQFSGRKLTWLHYLSNVDIRMNLSPGASSKTYVVNVSTFQLAMLLYFQNRNVANLTELHASTQVAIEPFVRHLQSLVDAKILSLATSSSSTANTDQAESADSVAKTALLVRQDSHPTLNAKLFVQLNLKFFSKKTKFKIAGAASRMNGDAGVSAPSSGTGPSSNYSSEMESLTQTHQAIDEDRKMYVQAAIVRVMKARKVMKHSHLVQEVISQCRVRFSPSVTVIKKCIESVIEKAYLERTPNTSDSYSYIA